MTSIILQDKFEAYLDGAPAGSFPPVDVAQQVCCKFTVLLRFFVLVAGLAYGTKIFRAVLLSY